ncbi:MAG: hypothetical protein ACJASV_002858, partial [Pseudorhodobacter sp.]
MQIPKNAPKHIPAPKLTLWVPLLLAGGLSIVFLALLAAF